MTEKMSLVNIVGPVDVFDEVAECCIRKNAFHAENVLNSYETGTEYTSFGEPNPYADSLKKIIEFASRADIKLHYTDYSSLDKTPEEIKQRIDGISQNYNVYIDNISELEKKITEDGQILTQLRHLRTIDTPIEQFFNFEFVHFRFGRMLRDSYEKMVTYSKEEIYFFIPTSIEPEYVWGMYFSTGADYKKVDGFFQSLGFERIRLSGRVSGTPVQAAIDIKKELDFAKTELEKLRAQYDAFMKEAESGILLYYSKIRALNDIYDVRKFAAHTTNTLIRQSFFLAGWVPVREAESLCERLEYILGVSCIIETPEENPHLTPPTKLRNIAAVKPFEQFVKLYGLPSYNETDPSPLFAFTYTLIFGIMFGDLGQGFLLFLAGLFFHFKMKKSFGQMLSSIGVSSMIFGSIYGSVFGSEKILKGLIVPMDNIYFMLIGAVAMGTVLVATVMTFNIRNKFKQKEFANALFSSNGIAGLVFYCAVIIGVALKFISSVNVFTLPFILSLIVLPMVFFILTEPLDFYFKHKRAFKPERISDFVIETFFELFEILLSFITNTISFIRIGAFALSHAGMMMMVFALAQGASGSENPLVIIFGNLFIMCFEGFIVGIQVLRLEFYEMFSRFYDGNGSEFTPVTIHYEN